MYQDSKRGIHAYKLAKRLRELLVNGEINEKKFGLYFDPDENPHLDKPTHNVHVQPHLGDKGTHGTNLSQCDLMLASLCPNRAILLIEVEEGQDGSKPKTIIGDVFNIWMANAIRCNREEFQLSDTRLWVVTFEPTGGGKAKQYDGLQSRFDELRESVQEKLYATVRVTATEIVRVKGQDLVEPVVKKMRQDLPDLFTING